MNCKFVHSKKFLNHVTEFKGVIFNSTVNFLFNSMVNSVADWNKNPWTLGDEKLLVPMYKCNYQPTSMHRIFVDLFFILNYPPPLQIIYGNKLSMQLL